MRTKQGALIRLAAQCQVQPRGADECESSDYRSCPEELRRDAGHRCPSRPSYHRLALTHTIRSNQLISLTCLLDFLYPAKLSPYFLTSKLMTAGSPQDE